MPCFHPLSGWRARGSGPVLFVKPGAIWSTAIQVPCGQCIGCRLERSRQWAVRCMHEASLHDDNCFVTLTYSDENLPDDGSLRKRDWQLFAKRLRRRFGSFRFFHCGEYGERLSRPHYHACLFGFDFPDRKFYKSAGDGSLDTSDILDEVWGLGFCTVGNVTFESAAYVARYVMKKVTGDSASDYYGDKQPEYVTMSRRPGIASAWFQQFGDEVFPSDECIVRGHPCRPPRFYDTLLEAAEPELYDAVKRKRVSDMWKYEDNCTPERLLVREQCTEARVRNLKRPLDEV